MQIQVQNRVVRSEDLSYDEKIEVCAQLEFDKETIERKISEVTQSSRLTSKQLDWLSRAKGALQIKEIQLTDLYYRLKQERDLHRSFLFCFHEVAKRSLPSMLLEQLTKEAEVLLGENRAIPGYRRKINGR